MITIYSQCVTYTRFIFHKISKIHAAYIYDLIKRNIYPIYTPYTFSLKKKNPRMTADLGYWPLLSGFSLLEENHRSGAVGVRIVVEEECNRKGIAAACLLVAPPRLLPKECCRGRAYLVVRVRGCCATNLVVEVVTDLVGFVVVRGCSGSGSWVLHRRGFAAAEVEFLEPPPSVACRTRRGCVLSHVSSDGSRQCRWFEI